MLRFTILCLSLMWTSALAYAQYASADVPPGLDMWDSLDGWLVTGDPATDICYESFEFPDGLVLAIQTTPENTRSILISHISFADFDPDATLLFYVNFGGGFDHGALMSPIMTPYGPALVGEVAGDDWYNDLGTAERFKFIHENEIMMDRAMTPRPLDISLSALDCRFLSQDLWPEPDPAPSIPQDRIEATLGAWQVTTSFATAGCYLHNEISDAISVDFGHNPGESADYLIIGHPYWADLPEGEVIATKLTFTGVGTVDFKFGRQSHNFGSFVSGGTTSPVLREIFAKGRTMQLVH